VPTRVQVKECNLAGPTEPTLHEPELAIIIGHERCDFSEAKTIDHVTGRLT